MKNIIYEHKKNTFLIENNLSGLNLNYSLQT